MVNGISGFSGGKMVGCRANAAYARSYPWHLLNWSSLAKFLKTTKLRNHEIGILDITFYRDDLTLVDTQPIVEGSHLDFEVTSKTVLLVDDVIYTGRTTRAGLESILDYGRPKRVELVVLVDRGHRELPIQADYVGKYVETAESEVVEVRMPSIDNEEGVLLTTQELLMESDLSSDTKSKQV